MHYQVEVLTDNFTPSQVLELRKEAKREGLKFSSRRKPDGQVEIEIKQYEDLNVINRVRYVD